MDQLRVGDAEREAAVGVLGEQYALGRLTRQELDERSDAAWAAKTHGDLGPLFADLPVGPSGQVTAAPTYRPRPGARVGAGWNGRGRTGGNGLHGAGRYVAPLLFVLLALTVLTHLPFFLVALGIFVLLRRRRGWRPRSGQVSQQEL